MEHSMVDCGYYGGPMKVWLVVVMVATACSKTDAVSCGPGTVLRAGTCVIAPSSSKSPDSAPESDKPTEPDRQETMKASLMAKTTFTDALQVVRPAMDDASQGQWSRGGLLLALWASTHLRWQDVEVGKNETSFALVRKDSEEARGKRMCTSGDLVQIEKEGAGATKIYGGIMINDYGNIFSFYVAGTTGELVARSRARLCGIVIGTYDYPNSAGGTGHAVALVGMFDLPENRKP